MFNLKKKLLDSTLTDSRRQLHIQLSHRNICFATRKRHICLNVLIFVPFNQIFFQCVKFNDSVNKFISVKM